MTSKTKNASLLPFFAVLGVILLLGGVLLQAFFGLTAAPEGELLTQIKDAEREGLTLTLPSGGTLRSQEVRYARITVDAVGPDPSAAVAVATLDFLGTLDKSTKVSALGFQRIPFRRDEGEWRPTASLAPQLVAAVDLLERRRRALEAADEEALLPLVDDGNERDGGQETDARTRVKAALAPLRPIQERRYRVVAWYLRSERDDVDVVEAYRLQGTLPDRPVDEHGKTALRLVATGGGYSFSGALR